MVNSQSNTDKSTTFDKLQAILAQLHQKLETRFTLHPNPTSQELQTFSNLDGQISGSLSTWSGPEVDWLVSSWISNPQRNFSTMRLTTWLGSQIQVPHLAFELGAFPNVFFYIDYVPRVDLWNDLQYVERYYEPVDQTYLALRDNANLTQFVSKSLYVRQFQSPIHLCYTCPPTAESFSLIENVAQEMLDRWLNWVAQAEPVPEESRAALAERDLNMRRISAERDPGNQVVVRTFGAELADKLVRGLWGGDRQG